MREAAFLKINSGKWKKLEAILASQSQADPDELAGLYIEIVNDLSYARTFYPSSKTTLYLNALAGQIHQRIYRNKREDTNRLVYFWRAELPLIFRSVRRELSYAFLFFALSAVIGALSTAHDPAYARYILGDGYVNMTEANIEAGDPMAVYKQASAIDMFLGITLNNVLVSFRTFAAGIFLSLGTVFILFRNGLMLGTFQYFFYQKGLLQESALAIWVHGTLEISAIIIAGCAGLVMGNSLLFPGTYSRRRSLMLGAKKGLKMVIGLVPIFVVAGFLEGFVTRYTAMPLWLNVAIIVGSLGFICWYVLIYPVYCSRKIHG